MKDPPVMICECLNVKGEERHRGELLAERATRENPIKITVFDFK